MSRRGITKRRELPKDPTFNSETVGCFVKSIMRDGKLGLAYKIVYRTLSLVKEHFIKEARTSEEVLKQAANKYSPLLGWKESATIPEDKIGVLVFLHSLENIRPQVEVRSSRVGGDTRQVPRALTPARARALGFRLLKKAALTRKTSVRFHPGDLGMAKLLYLEIIDAYEGKGGAVKMCSDIHRMARANQAYVYVRPAASSDTVSA
jgi:small subunit ribosomal protein S7